MAAVGYEYLRQTLGLRAFAPSRPARVGPVTRVEQTSDALVVPAGVAPGPDEPLEHVLFALKHEGTDLQILAEAMPHVRADALLDALRATPHGRYLRLAGYLRELFTGQVLDDVPAIGGANVDLFDPARYVTGPAMRDAKWRVNFNGLGTPAWCATVQRTDAIETVMASRLPERLRDFTGALGDALLDRTLAWAYLHETRDSFAIEREAPSADKARAFVALLQQAHDQQPLSEDYLAQLQSATVSNPVDRAVAFRHEQNWLEGPGRGALAVSYLPPPPALAAELMGELMRYANAAAGQVDPIVLASVISFGFVYVHPFMDGNGRLSRFLYHHALCRAGALDHGLVLPVSVAMKKHEADYLRVLQSYSRPARERWQVEWIDAGQYAFTFTGHAAMYRYWDATDQVTFGSKMAEQALEVELRQEADFLERYDTIVAAVNAEYDVRGSDLSTLVVSCLDNHGVVSKRRRDQFGGRVPEAVFDLVERLAAAMPGGGAHR
ncbi:Fic family protein [Luteimonas arsenica]|uniref:Fic family protein n=1 Tax=Luteimonas arsenica TaxID=1586242 RepID=UPI0010555114|nr:Fic family protein [Luteimonas arsenica]